MNLRLLFPVLLAACTAGGNNYGLDSDLDSDTDLDTADVDTDSDTEDDSDIDTDTDPDTTQGQTGGPGPACHPADPLGVSGWTRTYSTTFEDTGSGTETQSVSNGLVTTPGGDEAYLVTSTINITGQEPVIIESWRTCSNGEALWLADRTQASTELLPGVPLPATTTRYADDPEPYLPGLAVLQSFGEESYSYNLMIKGGGLDGFSIPTCTSPEAVDTDGDGVPEPDASCLPISGTYTVFGPTNVTVNGTTWAAFRIIDEKTEHWSQAGAGGGTDPIMQIILELFGGLLPGFGGGEDKTIVRDAYYVQGIGVVKETIAELPPGSGGGTPNILITRELQSYTGLGQ